MASKMLLFARLLRPNVVSKKSISTSSVRNGDIPHGAPPYRNDVPPVDYGPRIKLLVFCQSFFWFNVLFNFWYSPEIALGHPLYPIPDPSKWSDQDLGIPPDDYDEVIELGKAYYVR